MAAAALALLAGVATAPIAESATLRAGDTLRIEFITTPPFTQFLPNTLYAFLGYTNLLYPYTTITVSPTNGDTLLGTSTSTNANLCAYTGTMSYYPAPATWKSSASPWNHPVGDPAVVNFSSLLNGSIDGRIEFTINAGSFEFDVSDVALRFLYAQYANGGQSIPPSPIVTSVSIVPGVAPPPPSPTCATPPPPPPPPPPPVGPPPPPPSGTVPPPAVVVDDDDITMQASALRAACEQSQGNTVVMNHSVTVTNGSSSTEYVATDCTIVLGANVSLTFDRTSVTFAGPLTVQTQSKASVKLDKSMLAAPSVTFNLTAPDSALIASDSTLQAPYANLLVALGRDAKLEILRQFSGQDYALAAGDSVRITGGQKFLGVLVGAAVSAPGGFHLDVSGAEAAIKFVDGVAVAANQGPVAITVTGAKGLAEFDHTDFSFAGTLTLRLTGTESTIKLSQVSMGQPADASPGAVTVEAGTGSASLGKVEASQLSIEGVGPVTIRASKSGSNGLLKLENSALSAAGDVLLESRGTTEVKDNSVSSLTRIVVGAGPGGSCVDDPNSFAAPLLQLCP